MGKKKKETPLLIGITGGIGAGKSLLSTFFREQGFPVLSADTIAREIVEPGSPALEEIRTEFGAEALRADGTLNRAHVREKIAKDPNLRLKLEAITHPKIQARSQELAKKEFDRGANLVFYEAPLLFEAKSDHNMDLVICVHAPDELRLERTMKRDSVSQDQAERLLKSQMPQIEKINRSDFAIENAGTETDLRESGKKLLLELKKQITRD